MMMYYEGEGKFLTGNSGDDKKGMKKYKGFQRRLTWSKNFLREIKVQVIVYGKELNRLNF